MSINLAGRVLDDTGVGLNNATVQALSWGSSTPVASTTTVNDAKGQPGYWSFTGLANDQYVIQVSYFGKVRQTFGPSQVQFNQITLGAGNATIDSNGNATFGGTLGVTGIASFTNLVDGTGTLRAKGQTVPVSGVGVEISYLTGSSAGNIAAYDRGAGAYKDIVLQPALTVYHDGGIWAGYTTQVDPGQNNFGAQGTLNWRSGTTNLATLSHANTAARTYTFPDASDTVGLINTAQTLTNKTLTTPILSLQNSTARGSLGFDSSTNLPTYGDGSANHWLVSQDVAQTLTNKTLSSPVLNSPAINSPSASTSQVGNLPVKLASQTIGAGGGNFSFSAIPSGFSSLRLVIKGQAHTASSNASDNVFNIQFNGDTGANYDSGDNFNTFSLNAGQTSSRIGWFPGESDGAPYAAVYTIDIPGYADSFWKTYTAIGAGRAVNPPYIYEYSVGTWHSGSAISSLATVCSVAGVTFTAGSHAELYGLP